MWVLELRSRWALSLDVTLESGGYPKKEKKRLFFGRLVEPQPPNPGWLVDFIGSRLFRRKGSLWRESGAPDLNKLNLQ